MQLRVNVVTSCSFAGWKAYGQRFVETFNRHWPRDVGLFVVSEDALELPPSNARMIKLVSLLDIRYAREFLERHADHAWAKGDTSVPRPEGVRPVRRNEGTHFRFDAYKFCKKVFAIAAVANSIPARVDGWEGNHLFWLDADALTFANVPSDMFLRVLPKEYPISCLARGTYHSECGFVGYNLAHPTTRFFISAFAATYSTDKVFELEEWHDSWVFDYLRKQYCVKTFEIPHKSKSHPFINSELGLYMDHLKGARRKQVGRSQAAEQLKHRNVAYWQRF